MVTAADSLSNNSVLIHKFSVKEDEQYEKVEVEEENGEGSAPFEDVDHKKNGTRILEPLGLKDHLRSGSPTPQPVANPDTPMIEEGNDSCRISNSDETRGTNYSSLDGKRTVVLSDLQALKCDSGETTHENQLFGQKVRAEFTEGCHHQVLQDSQQTSSRLDAEETWARSLTPLADSRGGNKRAADICEFYSRGSKYTTERPASYCFSDFASSEVQCGGYQRLNRENDLHMHKDEDWSSMPFRYIGRETLGYKSSLAGYGSSSPPLLKDDSLNKDSYCSGMLPSSSVLSSYKYLNAEVSSYASALDGTSYKRTHLMPDYHHLPFLHRSVDRWPSYLTSSSYLDPVGDQKLLDRSQDCLTRGHGTLVWL
ncbi:uncharacterized protein LOC107032080 isoform X1 [Solanum pennellii]|uniref:Uncharacterized protein LOC107032080 isoform X1 n=1 Tax=Solanum pennellii TaxID=28526 RepID=A0ABM1HR45_SOLPN|nr:uncharacterized protein LOC107032080 isoform X1 [Solanum pennellii]